MEHKEQISLYLSGLADRKTERETEKALLRDDSFLDSFIETVGQRLSRAPSGLQSSVMRLIESAASGAAPVAAVPMLGKRLAAAACFCSAAVIMLITLSGFDRQLLELVSQQPLGLDRLLELAKNFVTGGN